MEAIFISPGADTRLGQDRQMAIAVTHDEVGLAAAGCAPTPLALARIPRDASFPRVLYPGREVWS